MIKTIITALFLGILLIPIPSFAETKEIQLTPEGCVALANSVGNIAQARVRGLSKEDAYKFYEEHLNVPKEKFTAEDKLIYWFVQEQIDDVYKIPMNRGNFVLGTKDNTHPSTPQDLAEQVLKACYDHEGHVLVTVRVDS